MNNKTMTHTQSRVVDIVKGAIVAALYVALTFILAPLSFGPLNLRISEGLNFIALYNKRYVYAITLGVFIVNYFAYGVLDMIVGSISTYIFLFIGRYLGDKLVSLANTLHPLKNSQKMLVKYAILAVVFSASMFTIAGLVYIISAGVGFWATYGVMAVTEFLAMVLGGFIVYPLANRVNFED